MNRKRYTTARASAARIASASALAGAATLAALAWTSCSAASARWTDESTAKAAGFLTHGTRVTVGDLQHAPRELREAVWSQWSRDFLRDHKAAAATRRAHASARVIDFATGRADTVDEADLMNASPAAVRAAIDSGRLD
jgi:hypothetical protein